MSSDQHSVTAADSRERLVLFTRYPTQGQTKTRLIPALGAEGAARLQRRLTLRTLRCAQALAEWRGVQLEVHFHGGLEQQMQGWLGDQLRYRLQSPGDLGQRMGAAFEQAFNDGCPAMVLIGSDCPELRPELLDQAFELLRKYRVVLGPARDGGYYLIGMRPPLASLFSGPIWGSDQVLSDTLKLLEDLNIRPFLLEPLVDIDRPEDLGAWERISQAEAAGLARVSVIIPSLNEAGRICATIASARDGGAAEVIVVDGGSSDSTRDLARQSGAVVLLSGPGRARQMNAGAAMATAHALLFLHADTFLPADYVTLIDRALAQPGVSAGAFRFAIRDAFPGRNLVEWATNLRSRWRQMPYGDQALFVRRSLFEELGGYADLPLLEDYELVRRLRRCGRVAIVPAAALTSGRRWQRLGLIRTTLLNQWIILGYRLRVPVDKLAVRYRDAGK